MELPGIGKLNTARDAQVNAISCAAASRCSAGGFYVSKKAGFQTFVDTQS